MHDLAFPFDLALGRHLIAALGSVIGHHGENLAAKAFLIKTKRRFALPVEEEIGV